MGPRRRRGTSKSSNCFQTSSAFGFLVFMFGSRVWDGGKLTANRWEKRKRANTESSEIGAQRVQRNENAGPSRLRVNRDAPVREQGGATKWGRAEARPKKKKPRRSRGVILYRIECTSGLPTCQVKLS